MKKDFYTTALVGTGRIGFSLMNDKLREQPASHTSALLKNKRIRLNCGCDSDPDKLRAWKKFVKNSTAYDSIDKLLESESPDIITIAVNESNHLTCAKKAIEAHPSLVILEKPVALNTKEGEELERLSISQNVPVLINHERRHALDYRLVKDYIKTIGKINTITARLDTSFFVYSEKERATGDYSLLHDGTHLLDVVEYLLEDEIGEEDVLLDERINCITFGEDKEKNRVVRYLNVHYKSKKCPDINIIFSGESRYFGFWVDVIGVEGRATVGNGVFNLMRRTQSKLYSGFFSLLPDKSIKRVKKTEYFSRMVENAVNFLDGKEPLRSPLKSGVNTLRLIDEIIESIPNKGA